MCFLLIQTAHAQIADGRYNIVSRHSGKSLDVFDFSTEPGGDCILAGGNGSTVTFNPPYSYNLLATSQVKNHALANAGVGKCNL